MQNDLQTRLNAVFGALKNPQDVFEPPAWTLCPHTIFRAGTLDASDQDDIVDEHEEERRRRVRPGAMIDLVEEEMVAENESFRPSISFCRSVDAEPEFDREDFIADFSVNEVSLSVKETEVLAENVYEMRLKREDDARRLQGREMEEQTEQENLSDEETVVVEEEERGVKRGSNFVAEPSMAVLKQGSPFDLAEDRQERMERASLESAGTEESLRRRNSTPLKSSFKQSSSLSGMKKRVSFIGVPEDPKPYVPPFRRRGYTLLADSICKDEEEYCGVSPDNGMEVDHVYASSSNPTKETEGHTKNFSKGENTRATKKQAPSIPDYVRHPERYTRYDLGQAILVGGGMAQLADDGNEAHGGSSIVIKEFNHVDGVPKLEHKEASEMGVSKFNHDSELGGSSMLSVSCASTEPELRKHTFVPSTSSIVNPKEQISNPSESTKKGSVAPSFMNDDMD